MLQSQIKATLEIARRFNATERKIELTKVEFTEDVVKLFKARMSNLKNEIFEIILLNSKNTITDTIEISKGTPTGTNPIIREIISKALQKYASGIICIHNHPSGDSTPTKEDEVFTKALKEALKLMNIKFLDHIIFGKIEYFSFDKCKRENYV